MAAISINETTTFRWTFDEDVLAYADAGIAAMGVWRQKLSDFGEAKGIELLAETGMAVSNFFWAGGFTGSDGRSYKDAVKDAKEAIDLAAALRAGCLIVHSGARSGHTNGHARRLLRDGLQEILPAAERADVVLALEPMHPGCAGEWTMLTNLDDTLSLLDEVGSPRVKIVLDTYQFGFDADIVEQIARIAPHVAIVHLADGKSPPLGERNHCLLGHGAVPLRAILEALSAAGYDGYYDVELLGEDVEGIGYAEIIQHAKTAFDQLVGATV